jgi:hypothetical protein
MTKDVFNATALDKLINDSLLESDNLKSELNNINNNRFNFIKVK